MIIVLNAIKMTIRLVLTEDFFNSFTSIEFTVNSTCDINNFWELAGLEIRQQSSLLRTRQDGNRDTNLRLTTYPRNKTLNVISMAVSFC